MLGYMLSPDACRSDKILDPTFLSSTIHGAQTLEDLARCHTQLPWIQLLAKAMHLWV